MAVAKLNNRERRALRFRIAENAIYGGSSTRRIAESFGISHTTANRIADQGYDVRCRGCIRSYTDSERGKRLRTEYMQSPSGMASKKFSGINRDARMNGYSVISGSPQDVEIMLRGKKNCDICGIRFKLTRYDAPMNAAVDHCHMTGRLRGVLCHNCNHLLGKAEDRVDRLEAAITYLTKANGG